MMVRCVGTKEQLGEFFMENLPKVGSYVGANATGAPFGRYPEFADEKIVVEIGFPVAEHLDASADVEPGVIPGGRYAVATHVGSYDGLPQTYDALFKWVHENAHQVSGPPFESYVDDSQSTAPDEVRTEIFVPIG